MKNTAINTLGYTGTVTLSQYINGKKRIICQEHNRGNYPLFDFLADCLIGDFEVASLDRPNKIMLLRENEQHELEQASTFIYMLNKPEKTVTEGATSSVKYSFLIPNAMLKNTFSSIGLYNSRTTETDLEHYAAFCNVKDKIKQASSITSALVIDWELNISNKNGDN